MYACSAAPCTNSSTLIPINNTELHRNWNRMVKWLNVITPVKLGMGKVGHFQGLGDVNSELVLVTKVSTAALGKASLFV